MMTAKNVAVLPALASVAFAFASAAATTTAALDDIEHVVVFMQVSSRVVLVLAPALVISLVVVVF